MQSIVAKYAELLFTISDIALLICVDKDILRDDIADNSTNISKLYHSSKLVTIAKLRRQEIEQAEPNQPLFPRSRKSFSHLK